MKSENGAGKLLFQYDEDKILEEVKEYITGTRSSYEVSVSFWKKRRQK
jgi:hypothetical protein